MTALDLEPNVDAISNITRTFLAVHRKDRSGGGRPLELVSTLGGAASVAEDESCTAIFAGGFFDRNELIRRFAGGQSSLEDAELLVLAGKEGRLQLALRNTLDTLSIATAGAKADQLSPSAAPPRAPRVSSPNRVAQVAPRVDHTVIEGYRGGERTLTTFQKP